MSEVIDLGIDGDPFGKAWRNVMRARLENRADLPKFACAPLHELVRTQRLRKFEDRCRVVMYKTMDETFMANKEVIDEFLWMARNRLIMGSIRYGQIGDETKPKYDRFASIHRRMLLNFREPNMEHLIDIFNEVGLEYTEPFGPSVPKWSARDQIMYQYHDVLDLEEKQTVFAHTLALMEAYVLQGRPDALVGIGLIALGEYLVRHAAGQRPVASDDGPVHTS